MLLLAFAGLTALGSSADAQSVGDPRLRVTQVVSGLSLPTAMAFIGPADILVLQKNDGRVRRVINGVLQTGQVLDLAVDNDSERGLLGVTLHPDFPTTPSVYLYYTQSSTTGDTSGSPPPLRNRVDRYTWNGTALVSPTLILDLPVTPGPNHDGGTMTFGPDGKLYVVIGELNRNGQLQNNSSGAAPDDTGVIFRVNDDGTIPTDNPFFTQAGNLPRYYAYGIRNSFGLGFDPVTGKLWDTENGPGNYDEINLVDPGFNSGWNKIMGPDGRDPQGVGDLFTVGGSHHYSDPEFSWFNTVAPTGIRFLSSRRLGLDYENDVFVGDNNNGRVYHFEPNVTRTGFDFTDAGLATDLVGDNATELQETIFGSGFGVVTDIKVGPDGLLYVLSLGLGRIFTLSHRHFIADFDDDRTSEIVVYRGGAWLFHDFASAMPTEGVWTGTGPGCIPAPMDYDGDGRVDFTQLCNEAWHFYNNDGTYNKGIWTGGVAGDLPVPADYDGDGIDDVVVFRNGAWLFFDFASGAWLSAQSVWTGAPPNVNGGSPVPVPMDYDGDGKADFTVYSGGPWHFFNRNGSYNKGIWIGGVPGDIPVPADYDGNGTEDVVVFRNGAWLFFDFASGAWLSAQSVWTGAPPDANGGAPLPAPLDYDGDGAADFTVYSGGPWHFYNQDGTYNKGVWTGGVAGDRPISRRLLP
jgi:aldose sugar dehydrogenase